MDLAAKKRKADENASFDVSIAAAVEPKLPPADACRVLDPLSKDQLLDILQDTAYRHPDILEAIRALTDGDMSLCKLFIRDLGWDTATDGLHTILTTFDDLQEAIVIVDKATDRARAIGLVLCLIWPPTLEGLWVHHLQARRRRPGGHHHLGEFSSPSQQLAA